MWKKITEERKMRMMKWRDLNECVTINLNAMPSEHTLALYNIQNTNTETVKILLLKYEMGIWLLKGM